jgi:hypothetical protein
LVKTANVGEDVGEALPVTAFADPDRRLFPVHTEEDALLSMAYATKQASVPLPVLKRINTALSLYEVSLPEEVSVKVAEPQVVYLLEDTKQFPLKTAADLGPAEEALVRNSKKLRPETLSRASLKLVKMAAANDEPVGAKVLAWAGLATCDVEKAASWISARGVAAPEGQDHYDAVAEALRSNASVGSTSRDDLVKVAAAVSELDKMHSLERHYGKKLPSPQETVFNTKQAMGRTLDLAGKPISLTDLLRVDPAAYGDILGEDIVKEISEDGELVPEKVLEIFGTLPRDMQQQLVSNLSL